MLRLVLGLAGPKRLRQVAPRTWDLVLALGFAAWICLILATAGLTVWAIVSKAPLEQPANPGYAPNPAKAPWYFLWLQEIVTDTTIRIGSFTLKDSRSR